MSGIYNGPDGQKLHGDGRRVRELQGESSLAQAPGSETLDARRHARTLKEFYSSHDRDALKPLVRTAITLGEEVDRLREALRSIQSFPVHSEPVGGAMAMQEIAHAALSPNTELRHGGDNPKA